jgi:hypothetical protein
MTTDTPKHVPPVTPTTPVTNTSAKVASTPTPASTVKAKVSPNVIQPSPTAATIASEPKSGPFRKDGTLEETDRKNARKWGYSLGPNEPPATVKVKNIHTIALNLEAGIIQPGDTGLATEAERSNFLGQYLEVV